MHGELDSPLVRERAQRLESALNDGTMDHADVKIRQLELVIEALRFRIDDLESTIEGLDNRVDSQESTLRFASSQMDNRIKKTLLGEDTSC